MICFGKVGNRLILVCPLGCKQVNKLNGIEAYEILKWIAENKHYGIQLNCHHHSHPLNDSELTNYKDIMELFIRERLSDQA